MKVTITLLFTSLFFVNIGKAQVTFEHKYSADGFCIQQINNGGYIACGYGAVYDSNSTRYYACLIKLSHNGDTVWTKEYSNDSIDIFGRYAEQTSDGGFIIAGATNRNNSVFNNNCLIKTDSSGNIIWFTTFSFSGPDHTQEVHQTTDGGYIITGYSNGVLGVQDDVFLVKTNSTGTVLWSKTYGGTSNDEAYSVHQTPDHGYILTGNTTSFGTVTNDIYLIKTDSVGATQWSEEYTGGNVFANAITPTTGGGYLITGSIGGVYIDTVLLLKVNNTGIVSWAKKYWTSKTNNGYCAYQTSDNGYIVTGSSDKSATTITSDNDVLLLKTDSVGNYQWAKTYSDSTNIGVSVNDVGYTVQQTTDGGYAISARSTPALPTTPTYLYLIKTDANGNVGCATSLALNNSATPITGSVVNTVVTNAGTVLAIPIVASNANPSVSNICTNSTGIAEINNNQPTINIYPNPASDNITINYTTTSKSYIINIYNAIGSLVKTIECKNSATSTINLQDFRSGIYLVSLIDGNAVLTKRFVKE